MTLSGDEELSESVVDMNAVQEPTSFVSFGSNSFAPKHSLSSPSYAAAPRFASLKAAIENASLIEVNDHLADKREMVDELRVACAYKGCDREYNEAHKMYKAMHAMRRRAYADWASERALLVQVQRVLVQMIDITKRSMADYTRMMVKLEGMGPNGNEMLLLTDSLEKVIGSLKGKYYKTLKKTCNNFASAWSSTTTMATHLLSDMRVAAASENVVRKVVRGEEVVSNKIGGENVRVDDALNVAEARLATLQHSL